ncbi:MAG: hypothetical protein CMH22_06065 [Methylophaga sp.]|nr:hypothetical protein [Methylophaga sp.]
MSELRVDHINTKIGVLSLLVHVETNKIYFSMDFNYKKKTIKKVYSEFKYFFEELKYTNMFLPQSMLDRLEKVEGVRYGTGTMNFS